MESIEKDYDKSNRMDMSDDKDSDERYKIIRNDEETFSDGIEVFKLEIEFAKNIYTMLRKNLMKVIGWI